ncbi:hypothetical protein B0H17DRAFT_1141770 [Mycena rosella]|uniref:Uncharacterized protein n=1 Tax=Mycena rosella TaxID=1033263 RepID=A0AAD7CZ64_MYCRO|nr:hypothetical protein B0H17DRAFT_1141770 [Mycena rosella]
MLRECGMTPLVLHSLFLFRFIFWAHPGAIDTGALGESGNTRREASTEIGGDRTDWGQSGSVKKGDERLCKKQCVKANTIGAQLEYTVQVGDNVTKEDNGGQIMVTCMQLINNETRCKWAQPRLPSYQWNWSRKLSISG